MNIEKIKDGFLSVLLKIGENKRLVAIRNGITITSPFTIIGSLFLIVGNLPIPGWNEFIAPFSEFLNAPVNVTFGVLGLIAATGMGYNMGKELKVSPVPNTIMTVVVFLLATLTDEYGINLEALGVSGMFTAIIISIFVTEVHLFFVSKGFVIKMPDGVPVAVAESFTSLFPAAAAIVIVWILRVILGVDLNAFFELLFSPLIFSLNTLPGLMVKTLLICLLWSCGIHGDNVLAGIVSPIYLSYQAANLAAFQAGLPIPYEVAGGYWIVFMCLGGTGSTLGLVILMMNAKSKMFRSLGKLSLPSAIFCINEPVIFGFPIVMNPIMMIPFILTPMVLGAGTFMLMRIGLVGKIIFDVPWTTPPVLGAYLATNGHVGAAIWSVISIFISVAIYYPFFRAEDNRQALVEQTEEAKKIASEDLAHVL